MFMKIGVFVAGWLAHGSPVTLNDKMSLFWKETQFSCH